MLLTIFTPAYNRADKLNHIYKSLLSQADEHFEWLIIDDGSTDHTEDIVKNSFNNGSVKIRYVKKENGGKHTAHNVAVELTDGEYQPEGLSNNLNSIMKKNPAGYCLYFRQRIDMQTSFKERIITAGKYHCFCIFSGNQRSLYAGKHKNLVFLCKPIGLLFWVYYKLLRNF